MCSKCCQSSDSTGNDSVTSVFSVCCSSLANLTPTRGLSGGSLEMWRASLQPHSKRFARSRMAMREPMIRFSSPDRMFAMMPGKSLCNVRTRSGSKSGRPSGGRRTPAICPESRNMRSSSAPAPFARCAALAQSVASAVRRDNCSGRAHRTSGGAMISVSSRLSRTSAFSSVGSARTAP